MTKRIKPMKRILSLCALLLLGVAGSILNHPHAASASNATARGNADRVSAAYARLPLQFERNAGQTNARVKFLSRGPGYAFFLTPEEAVMTLRDRDRQQASVRMKLLGANPAPRISGREPQEGATTYLTGTARYTSESFGRVEYAEVWPGIDLTFYGNQQQLEYDFLVAPGAAPKTIRLGFDGIERLRIDDEGGLVLRVAGREVRWLKPFAYQTAGSERRAVDCAYRILSKREIGFSIGAYDRARPLVIDPAYVYSTYLGGVFEEAGNSLAVDAAGNAYVAGSTVSIDFFTVNPLQSALGSQNQSDAFILKLAPNGSQLIYATYLGGNGRDAAHTVAIDAAGNAYLAGTTDSTNFPGTAGGVQPAGKGYADGFVAKLNPAGSQLLYATYLGGSFADAINGLAVDAAGNAYLTGQTESSNFPTTGNSQPASAAILHKSSDAAMNWTASASGLPGGAVRAIAFRPRNTSTILLATSTGLFRSADAGASWSPVNDLPVISGIKAEVSSILFDPKTPDHIYLGTTRGVYKSLNGGQSFQYASLGLSNRAIAAIVADPVNPATLYAATANGVFKSANSGETWIGFSSGIFPLDIRSIAIDSVNPATLYAGTAQGAYKTTNGGTSWTAINTGLGTPSNAPSIPVLAIDPSNPQILYAAASTGNNVLFKSTNGGANWAASDAGLNVVTGGATIRMAPKALAIGSLAYAATPIGLFKSADAGATWMAANNGLPPRDLTAIVIDPANSNGLLIGANTGGDAFVAKLNPTGSALVYSQYLGGSQNDVGTAIGVDAAGNAWIAGETSSDNFPLVLPSFGSPRGMTDAFLAKVDATDFSLSFSTYFGGSGNDRANAIAIDSADSVVIAGRTSSANLPTLNAFKTTLGGPADGFVYKIRQTDRTTAFATYFGGAGDDQITAAAVDNQGQVWVAGQTSSADFPLMRPLPPAAGSNPPMAFVSQFNREGKQLRFSTRFGGNNSDLPRGLALGDEGNVYIAGTTTSFDFPQVNPVPASNSIPNAFVVRIGPAPDLAVAMTTPFLPGIAGRPLLLSIVVRNAGDLPLTGIKLTYPLPKGAGFVSATPTQGTCTNADGVTCDLRNLAVGNTIQIAMVVTPPLGGILRTTVQVGANEPEPITANNSATLEVPVSNVDLQLMNTSSHLQIAPGAQMTWLVTVLNPFPFEPISGIRVQDELPAGVTVVSCTIPEGTCTGTGTSRTIAFPDIGRGSFATAVLTVSINADVAPGSRLTNSARILETYLDPRLENNQASATTTVVAASSSAPVNGLIAYNGINVIRPDGTGRFRLAAGAAPAWSPDGMTLAYGVGNFIRIVNADGTNERQVSTSGATPSWSPDGTRIAFGTFSDGIKIMNADGSGEQTVFRDVANRTSNLFKWSPDGTKLLGTNASAIVTLNIDGSGFRSLTTPPAGSIDSSPSWSPDGSKIIFVRGAGGPGDFYTINADGSGLARVGTGTGQSPVYSPDGKRLAFSRNNQLYVANVDASAPVSIATASSNSGSIGLIDWQRTSASAPQRLVISGRVRSGTSNVLTTIRLTGGGQSLDLTTEDGYFAFGNLRPGETYVVAPVSSFSRFEPASRSFNNLTTDQPAADFSATPLRAAVRGRITDAAGAPMAGVPLTINSGSTTLQTESDADGNYIFPNLFGGSSYTVRPRSILGGDKFEPQSITFVMADGDKIANFLGIRDRFSISGQAVDALGAAVAEASITITGGGRTRTLTTDAAGRYSATDLPGGSVYNIAAEKAGVSFSPATRRVVLSRNLDLRFFAGVGPVALASAANYNSQGITVGGITALFGEGLANTTRAASGTTLPFELDGVSVYFSNRNIPTAQRCQLFFVSPRQINFVIPFPNTGFDAASVSGEALLEVRQGTRVVAAGSIEVSRVAPALITADSSGSGPAAALALRVRADGTQVFEPTYRYDSQSGRFVNLPIDLGNPAEQVYLVLFGTGIRYRTESALPRVLIAGEDAMVGFAGPQPTLFSVDQVNALIPRTLAGRGEVDVQLSADGKNANVVRISLK